MRVLRFKIKLRLGFVAVRYHHRLAVKPRKTVINHFERGFFLTYDKHLSALCERVRNGVYDSLTLASSGGTVNNHVGVFIEFFYRAELRVVEAAYRVNLFFRFLFRFGTLCKKQLLYRRGREFFLLQNLVIVINAVCKRKPTEHAEIAYSEPRTELRVGRVECGKPALRRIRNVYIEFF